MSGFTVSADSLAAVQRTLGDFGGYLGGVSVSTSGFADVLGGGGLAAELDAFNEEWQQGIGVVADEIARLSAHLQQAVVAYEKIDGELASTSHAHRVAVAPQVHTVETVAPVGGHPRHHDPAPVLHHSAGGAPVTAGSGSGTTVIDPRTGSAGTSTGAGSGTGTGAHEKDKARARGVGSGTTTIVFDAEGAEQ